MCCDVHLQRLKKKSRSASRPRMAAECCWNHNGGTCVEVATAGNASGQQRAVIEHQQDQLVHEQTTIDADRAASTPFTPIAQDATGNLVDLRIGNKLETFASGTHEWK